MLGLEANVDTPRETLRSCGGTNNRFVNILFQCAGGSLKMDGRVVDAVIQASALRLYRAHFQVACRNAPANPCKAPVRPRQTR
jgi:hypothetical protein